MPITIRKPNRWGTPEHVVNCLSCGALIGAFATMDEARKHDEPCRACLGEPDPTADFLTISIGMRKLALDIMRTFPDDTELLRQAGILADMLQHRVARGAR